MFNRELFCSFWPHRGSPRLPACRFMLLFHREDGHDSWQRPLASPDTRRLSQPLRVLGASLLVLASGLWAEVICHFWSVKEAFSCPLLQWQRWWSTAVGAVSCHPGNNDAKRQAERQACGNRKAALTVKSPYWGLLLYYQPNRHATIFLPLRFVFPSH